MATRAAKPPPANDEHDEALEEQRRNDDVLADIHEHAMERFDLAVLPQLEMRSLALAARRFITISGAQWEGDFGDAFDNAIKLEINLTKDGLEKIYRDYNENRIVPDFRPAGGKGDEDSADTLDGMHRADSYCFKSSQARDNAFKEGTAGGFGAYRLTNEWADPDDPDDETQRINPGLTIVDADQRVFFDPDSVLYDKSDARYAFVITAQARAEFERDNEGALFDWPDLPTYVPRYDWYSPDVVKKAEYYEVEEREEKRFTATHMLSEVTERYWESELDEREMSEMKRMGWRFRTKKLRRKRVHKYVLSGSEVLHDKGIIAGDRIPIAPYYGKRDYVDGVERFEGYVQAKMDVQRCYNMVMSKIAETSAQSPRDIPIFASQQMPPHLAELWKNQVVERHAYALVDPLFNPVTGEPLALGPIGKVEAAQIDQATATLLQVARGDLVADQQDGSEEVKANTSEEAMEFAAARVDAKSGIYLDNWRQTVQCEGEIYLSMCSDVNCEPGREVETMDEDNNESKATLVEPYIDPKGVAGYRNDFSRGNYKVVVSVTEATTTRRNKTVKACVGVAQVATQLGDMELGQAALITAVANMDGEGMDELQGFARQRGIAIGVIEPTDEEKAAMDAAQQHQGPDPQAEVLGAQAEALHASAMKDEKLAEKAEADTGLSKARTVESLAKAHATTNPPAPAIQTAPAPKPSPFAALSRMFSRRR